MSTWTVDNIKKMIGRGCGDPDAVSYPDAIFDHFIIAIEELAEDITTIADLDRALTDDERRRYAEAINISENEIYPMLYEYIKSASFINKIASFAITNANFVKVIKVRDIYTNPQNTSRHSFTRLYSMKEFTNRTTNPHLLPRDDESVWLNIGNKVFIYWSATRVSQLWFNCLISLDYSGWSRSQNLQTLGFGSNFLSTAIKKATYTMRLQLNLEKE
ncbi:MAG: hypothetical protein KAH32_04560 [Chlamydiia bacterium]|nr:hypothetical protein [Chlamydiia bacterium]